MGKHAQKAYYDEAGNLLVKPYRLKDLASIFDINVQTLKRWLSKYPELGQREGKYYTVTQVQFCIEKFGLPQKLKPVILMENFISQAA
jgi:hypothetical protein